MSKEFDILIFIGRFQPLSLGHLSVINQAFDKCERLFVLVGSANAARSIRNPFTFYERSIMIDSANHAEGKQVNRLSILPINDFTYSDDLWTEAVQKTVDAEIARLHLVNPKVGLIGFNKDNTSFYLKLFPQWGSVEAKNEFNINATDIRNLYFGFTDIDYEAVPKSIATFLENFAVGEDNCITPTFKRLKKEFEVVRKIKESWANSPYPPVFVTTDAIVVQSGHILLIKRKDMPGEGLLALPGGYLGKDETIFDSCLRELREETRLKVPTPALRGSLVAKEAFDDPNRDPRGRMITHAFLFKLEPKKEENYKLPKVKGGDDAADARWYPLKDVKCEEMYADHYHIIRKMVGML